MTAKKILIVDDDPDMRETIRLLLGAEFEVLQAADGREAVELAGKERPRLVLLDVAMPGMTGVEVLGAMRAADPAVVVIVLTGESDVETARKALAVGAAAYVTKPFDTEPLRASVRRFMSAEPDDKNGRPWRIEDPRADSGELDDAAAPY
jgi:DNA-binding response OmpR family regulator